MTTEAARAIEAILMVAQEPIDPHLLAQLLEVPPARVEELCAELQAGYQAQQRGFVLARVAGGYRFQSHGDLAPYVERFVLEGQSAKLSAAALETLAIVAYKQPLSRAQVASIRGVNVDGVMRTLQQRGYVVEVGKDPGPGQATLFGTSREFLERMGLDRVEDLPPIAALFPSTEVMEALERGLRAEPVADPVAEPEAEPERSAHGAPDAPKEADADVDVLDPAAQVEVEVEVEAVDPPAEVEPFHVEAEEEVSADDPGASAESTGTAIQTVPDHEVEVGSIDAGGAPDVEREAEVESAVSAPGPRSPLDDPDDLDGPVPALEEPSWARRDEPVDGSVAGPDDSGVDDQTTGP